MSSMNPDVQIPIIKERLDKLEKAMQVLGHLITENVKSVERIDDLPQD